MKKTFLSVATGIAVVISLSLPGYASHTLTASYERDTFVISTDGETGLSGRNGREIAAPTTGDQARTEEPIIGFDLSSIKTGFDAQYPGGWVVTSVSISIGSNYPTGGVQPNNLRFNVVNPGFFTWSWLSNDSWDAGSLMYRDLYKYLPGQGSNTKEVLGTYYYFADGIGSLTWFFNKTPGLIADIMSGSKITILGEPGDASAGKIGYMFNPGEVLTVTADAAPVPIPPAFFLLGSGMAGIGLLRKRFTFKTNRKGGRS